jgi:CheY-like chemotaxis protein
VLLQPLKDSRGRSEGILIHLVEVTEAFLAAQRIDEARRAAESANRAKDEFLAMLGHELRNPLAPILTALQLMTLRGDIGAEKERAVIDRQVRHVMRLVDDLLDVSRITRGKVDLRTERVELAQIVARAIEMASPLIEQRQHDLRVEVAPRGLAVDGDPARLHQVVLNLLTNAAKYTEPKGRISVSGTREGEQIVLRVRDNGIGIAADMLPQVFDLFTQERQTIDRSQGGLGLGLTIVRRLIELHEGTVEGRSDGIGRGSEFTVRLPAASTPFPSVQRQAGRVPGAAPPTGGLRILIAEDNPDTAMLLAEALDALGHDTRTAADGPAALRVAATFRPQVALLDLGLPIMDGYELAAHLRETDHTLKMIAITGYGQESDRQRSRASGFDAHIVKPVDLAELGKTLSVLGAR